MEGTFKLHRKFFDSDLWLCEPFTRGQAWVDLIGLATHKYNYFFVRGIKVELERGQVGWSEPKLALRWKWSRTKLKNFLKVLEKEQQIVVHRDNVNQIITLINYDLYQPEEQQTIQQKNSRRTAEEQQKDVNKDIDSLNKEKGLLKEKNKEIKEAKKNEIIFPFESREFLKLWGVWKEYKFKEHSFKYKSEISEQAALKNLLALSNENETTAIKIIEQSMANSWSGLFKLQENGQSNNSNGSIGKGRNGGVSQSYRDKLLSDLHAGINEAASKEVSNS